MLRTNGRFETHSRISPAGMFSSLIRPSSVRTRTHVNSDVRATSRYDDATPVTAARSEEHTSELQSRLHLVCRLLLEKKKDVATTADATPLGASPTIPAAAPC